MNYKEGDFSWISFFNEMLNIICTKYDKNSLALVFNEIFPKQKDENPKDSKISFFEVDPLTFIACFNRKEKDKTREIYCQKAKDLLGISSPVPVIFDGIPIFSNLRTWFIQYSFERGSRKVDTLWSFAKDVISKQKIEQVLFDEILSFPLIGVSKLSQFLFITFPNNYYPMDSRSCKAIEFNKKDTFESFLQFQNKCKQEYPDMKPYELSYDAWQKTKEIKEKQKLQKKEERKNTLTINNTVKHLEFELPSSGTQSHGKGTYLETAKENAKIGERGEDLVMKYEQENLRKEGREDLAEKVDKISEEDDGKGYDILSFTIDGKNKYIEVKSTKSKIDGKKMSFFLTKNELETKKRLGKDFYLYFVTDIDNKPEFVMYENIENNKTMKLRAEKYKVTVKLSKH